MNESSRDQLGVDDLFYVFSKMMHSSQEKDKFLMNLTKTQLKHFIRKHPQCKNITLKVTLTCETLPYELGMTDAIPHIFKTLVEHNPDIIRLHDKNIAVSSPYIECILDVNSLYCENTQTLDPGTYTIQYKLCLNAI